MGQPTPIGRGEASDKLFYAGFWAEPWDISALPGDLHTGRLVTRLNKSFPNPFTSTAIIAYSLGRETGVKLRVYDIEGRVIRTLVSGMESPGSHQVLWDGNKYLGMRVGPGIYFCHFEAGSCRSVRRLVVLK
jgi:hypothetical protein